jgi:hypothetical protein
MYLLCLERYTYRPSRHIKIATKGRSVKDGAQRPSCMLDIHLTTLDQITKEDITKTSPHSKRATKVEK